MALAWSAFYPSDSGLMSQLVKVVIRVKWRAKCGIKHLHFDVICKFVADCAVGEQTS